jgi:alginate O-acetyltransferase complex protein AlgI
MLFNSWQFLLFFPIVTAVYFLLPHGWRWIWLLAASCFFYMAFIPAYILVLFAAIVIDYVAGINIEDSTNLLHKKRWFVVSILSTCGLLFVFKYFNFFNGTVATVAQFIHWNYPIGALSIALPIGLSFHTFQSLSYVIEVYYGRQKAERHFGIYSLYVMFYPQLVAGPIERPQHMLHQFHEQHPFAPRDVTEGLKIMAWGFFLKSVIADHVAPAVTTVYAHPELYSGTAILLATLLFAVQLYCDFAGYSLIATGAARVMGFRLMRNFYRPYFACSIPEFWKRWHISLSGWLQDYVYAPLALSRGRATRGWLYLCMLITFVAIGFWHGAGWTFLMLGALHGTYSVLSHATRAWRDRVHHQIGLDRFPTIQRLWRVIVTFSLVAFSWIFFRAATLSDAWIVITRIVMDLGSLTHLSALRDGLHALGLLRLRYAYLPAAMALLFWVEHMERTAPISAILATRGRVFRWAVYTMLIASLIYLCDWGAPKTFIYFQF